MLMFSEILTVTDGFPNIFLNNVPILCVYIFNKITISEISIFKREKHRRDNETHNEL